MPRLSRHLNPHSTVLTCPTGTAAPSPIPPMKSRPTRRHQGGSALTAAFYLLFDLTGLPVLYTEQPWRVTIDDAIANHSSTMSLPHVVASSAATSTRALDPAAQALARAAALFLLLVALLHCSCFRLCSCSALALACVAAAARPSAATRVATLALARDATA